MTERELKPAFAALLGLLALLYVIQNLVNLTQAYGAFDYVLGLQDHEAYPRNMLPAIPSPLANVVAWVVFAGEAATAFYLLKGAWDLWQVRRRDYETYKHAKTNARTGAAVAIFVWFGAFQVLGGAGYQMWQTELGSGSLGDAFTFSTFAFLLLIYLGQRER